MAKQFLLAGTTSWIDYVRITDMNGSPITGLTNASTGLLAKYVLSGAASVAISIISQTVTGAYSSGGFVEIDATAFPGLYRFDIPNNAIASGNKSFVSLYGYSGMNVSMLEYELVAFNPQDTVRLGLTALPNAVAGANGGLPLGDASGRVTLAPSQLFIKKNSSVVFPFVMVNSTTGVPSTGLTVTATRSIDGAVFGACANAVTEISNGWYVITLAAADTNGTVIALRFTATGASDRDVTVYTQT